MRLCPSPPNGREVRVKGPDVYRGAFPDLCYSPVLESNSSS